MSVPIRAGSRRTATANPWMMIAASAVALAVMVTEQLLPASWVPAWIELWGFKPAVVSAELANGFSGRADLQLAGLVTALFAHSNWLHLGGNLAYLWVFGIPVERAVGHVRFLLVFVMLGAIANLLVALMVPGLDRVILGASGGVSAVIGVYLGLFPGRRIGLWLPLGLFLQFARIPALLVIGSWFTLQLLYTVFGPMSDAVAWWTHTAGFVAGLLAAVLFRAFSGSVARLPED